MRLLELDGLSPLAGAGAEFAVEQFGFLREEQQPDVNQKADQEALLPEAPVIETPAVSALPQAAEVYAAEAAK